MLPKEWDLTGKRALITADRRGWTPYLAAALAEAGADVAVAGWRAEHVAQAAREVTARGRRSLQSVGDLAQRAVARATVEGVVRSWGGIDVLVNAAQAQFAKPFLDVSDDEWDQVMGYNVRAMYLLCQEAGRHMVAQGKGRIVNVISGLAERGLWNSAAYCASQGAALQLTRALALEWSQKGVRVNAIAAGWLSLEEGGSKAEEEKDPLARFIPMRRLGHPRELGPLAVYLASDACDFVTGQAVFVDGGAIAHG
ncbi:MAG: SDR family oxidoreductase [Chloroflexi bacterium]|nr:SDR family oxidoreductase [Chloroflexota bacterium]